MHKRLIAIGAVALAYVPLSAFAAASGIGNTLGGFANDAVTIVNLLVPFMVTLAVVFFFWGLAKFILSAGDEAARESGKGIMIWGVIAITVMVSIWGLVAFLTTSFGISENTAGPIIKLPK